jgi:hypothetical protein
MAFKTETERLAYEAEMQSYHKTCNQTYKNIKVVSKRTFRTDADRLMAYHDGQTTSSGGIALIILGLPLLIVPPLGLYVIGAGLAMIGYGVKRGIEADAK